jgi:hypothetical protein
MINRSALRKTVPLLEFLHTPGRRRSVQASRAREQSRQALEAVSGEEILHDCDRLPVGVARGERGDTVLARPQIVDSRQTACRHFIPPVIRQRSCVMPPFEINQPKGERGGCRPN